MRNRLRSHEGANAVEFALVLPILVVLIFGGIWAGLALNHDLSLSTAAREGARYAATLGATDSGDGTPVDSWYTTVLERTSGEATGSLGPGIPGARICVAYVSDSGTASRVIRTWPGASHSDTAKQGGTCLSDSLPSQKRVQVTTEREVSINAVFVHVNPTIGSEAVARYEKNLDAP